MPLHFTQIYYGNTKRILCGFSANLMAQDSMPIWDIYTENEHQTLTTLSNSNLSLEKRALKGFSHRQEPEGRAGINAAGNHTWKRQLRQISSANQRSSNKTDQKSVWEIKNH